MGNCEDFPQDLSDGMYCTTRGQLNASTWPNGNCDAGYHICPSEPECKVNTNDAF
jgi:hypothetical protein